MSPAATASPGEGLRERNKRRRADQILAATRALLREDPGQSPSVERIAARAEVAPATVFNLIGPRERLWAALADEALSEIYRRMERFPALEPHERARRIATTTVDVICADAAVFRCVLSHWEQSARLLRTDPTRDLVACLQAARDDGALRPDVDLRLLGELISTACTGALHQWAAHLIDDRALRSRCRAAVDLAFTAAAADVARNDYVRGLRSRGR